MKICYENETNINPKQTILLKTKENTTVKFPKYINSNPFQCQIDIIEELTKAFTNKYNIIIESPKNTGKTISAIASSVAFTKQFQKNKNQEWRRSLSKEITVIEDCLKVYKNIIKFIKYKNKNDTKSQNANTVWEPNSLFSKLQNFLNFISSLETQKHSNETNNSNYNQDEKPIKLNQDGETQENAENKEIIEIKDNKDSKFDHIPSFKDLTPENFIEIQEHKLFLNGFVTDKDIQTSGITRNEVDKLEILKIVISL